MKDTMVLKDGTVIELEAGASLQALQVAAGSREEMLATWDKFTEENLAEVQIKNGDGLVVGNYNNLILVSETSTVAENDAVLTSYCLREKTAEELRLDALEAGQSVQDGALNDLGEAVGELAEGGMA